MAVGDLYHLARAGSVEELREILQTGVDANKPDQFGSTALHQAVAANREEIVEFLLAHGADPSSTDADGFTPVHVAVARGLPQVVMALLAIAPQAISISNKHGNQPLWTAAFNARGNYELVLILLRHGADPNHKNKVGLCPLDIAKRKGEQALLELLQNAAR